MYSHYFHGTKTKQTFEALSKLTLPHCLCSIQLRSYHLSRELYRFFICQCLAHINTSKPSTCSILWCSVAFEICSWYRREGICEELSHELASSLLTMPLCHAQTMYNKRCDGVSSSDKWTWQAEKCGTIFKMCFLSIYLPPSNSHLFHYYIYSRESL